MADTAVLRSAWRERASAERQVRLHRPASPARSLRSSAHDRSRPGRAGANREMAELSGGAKRDARRFRHAWTGEGALQSECRQISLPGWVHAMGEAPVSAAPEDGAAGLDALLATKLHIPRARHGLVPRPRLVDRLTEAVAGELTVVCAPAGFGKTALLADWARRSGRPVAWLSLDTADNDPVRFWRHVAAALGSIQAGAAQRLTAVLGPPLQRSPEAVVTALVNELAAAPAVHVSVVFLLEHLPAGLRLAVACRADPPLPLARLRAGGSLAELRA